VQPAHLAAFNQQLRRAQQAIGGRLRLPLVPSAGLEPEFNRITAQLRGTANARVDTLYSLLLRHEVNVSLATQALTQVQAGSPLAAHILADRAHAQNLLARFAPALADAEAALAVTHDLAAAQNARAVALVGLDRLDEALPALDALALGGSRQAALKWTSSVQLLRGQPAAAEANLREVLSSEPNDARAFDLLWLYLAAERQGRGREAIAPHLANTDVSRWPGALLHHFGGLIDRDAVLKSAAQRSDMERLNLAEAWFYLGQQALARGQTEDARLAMGRVLDTGALPYREHTFARLFLERLNAR
jgi:lipoprotein NlpI